MRSTTCCCDDESSDSDNKLAPWLDRQGRDPATHFAHGLVPLRLDFDFRLVQEALGFLAALLDQFTLGHFAFALAIGDNALRFGGGVLEAGLVLLFELLGFPSHRGGVVQALLDSRLALTHGLLQRLEHQGFEHEQIENREIDDLDDDRQGRNLHGGLFLLGDLAAEDQADDEGVNGRATR